jgi:hypothetical protein
MTYENMVGIMSEYIKSNKIKSFTLREVMEKTNNIEEWDSLKSTRQKYGQIFKKDKEMHQKLNIKHIEVHTDVVEYLL